MQSNLWNPLGMIENFTNEAGEPILTVVLTLNLNLLKAWFTRQELVTDLGIYHFKLY